MFGEDPIITLENKVYSDFETLQQEVQQQVRQYVETRLEEMSINTQNLRAEIDHAERKMLCHLREEVRKEMCRLSIEQESVEHEDQTDRASDSLIRRETLVNEARPSNTGIVHSQIIVEDTKENEDESGNSSSDKDPSQLKEDLDDYQDFADVEDLPEDMANLSPPNKLPESFVESRNSILHSEASSSKMRDSIHIFGDSAQKENSEINRSFQQCPYSDNSSMKKMKYYRNISQKYLNSQEGLKLNESNILRERNTDTNNISNIKSNESITISHRTFNHSNYESEKVSLSNPKTASANAIKSCIDLEKKRIAKNKSKSTIGVNNRDNTSQVVNSVSLGSPISMFNPEKRLKHPTVANHDNMTLEEMISRIDSRREVFKKSVREEMEDYMGVRQSTPQFTDCSNSNFFYQSTNDQVSTKAWQDQPNVQNENKCKSVFLTL